MPKNASQTKPSQPTDPTRAAANAKTLRPRATKGKSNSTSKKQNESTARKTVNGTTAGASTKDDNINVSSGQNKTTTKSTKKKKDPKGNTENSGTGNINIDVDKAATNTTQAMEPQPGPGSALLTGSTRPMQHSGQANQNGIGGPIDENSIEYWKAKVLELQAQQTVVPNTNHASNTGSAANGTQATNVHSSSAAAESIEVILKPKGEAGDKKRGYNFQEAVKIEDNEEWNTFLSYVRDNRTRCGLVLGRTFRQQDNDAILQLCRLTAKELPYFNKRRFPNYWPVREALKQSLKNSGKYQRRKASKKQGAEADADAGLDISDEDIDVGASSDIDNDDGISLDDESGAGDEGETD
ncbi:hypothetical protein K435DRAFT_878865 [Dendrothele bispora CBS 962.96]|uniref:Uncharacterized protein n=1 Tax=Dendrothele bispora (strain CBS 962.96) TaxID=1314807 RepID=A0A4V4HAT5_DENBC|nr:hypothetical protein K435DRAFT_878865 [Dendrothele bispora CBS 962.96]